MPLERSICRRNFHVTAIALFCAVIASMFGPNIFYTSSADSGISEKGKLRNPLSNYDIRQDKDRAETLRGFRESLGLNAASVADVRESFVRGESALKALDSDISVEYNSDIGVPEVISPNVWKAHLKFLSAPSTQERSEILRGFVRNHQALIGVTSGQAEDLEVTADYTNPNGELSFAHLEQRIGGIPVFRGEVKAGFTKDGRIIRVINNLAP
ncbi:MAG: hypothetical protein WBD22_00960, partial [Pyrinomonadaceae bacterium]